MVETCGISQIYQTTSTFINRSYGCLEQSCFANTLNMKQLRRKIKMCAEGTRYWVRASTFRVQVTEDPAVCFFKSLGKFEPFERLECRNMMKLLKIGRKS